MEVITKIKQVEALFQNEIKAVRDLEAYEVIKIKYLGKKGLMPELFKLLKEVAPAAKGTTGKLINDLAQMINQQLDLMKTELTKLALQTQLEQEKIDVTLPGVNLNVGTLHPLNLVIKEICDFFISCGYDVISGPEIETDLYNFEYLNLPKHHPARAMQDTFYLTPEVLLRTQTSPAQIRTMLDNKEKTPIQIVCPGKVYRRDQDDATHSHQFMQIEGLVVGHDVSLAHLKGTLELLVKHLFGQDRVIRFRPSYFPFTEPSIEVDVNCFKCDGKGCSLCKKTGWIEILGAGMVHPYVLERCDYDSKLFTGFAFGLGVERIAMLKYGIDDIRDFYTNDIRFLKQFVGRGE